MLIQATMINMVTVLNLKASDLNISIKAGY
jgi:hypothetical protein